MSTIKIAFLAPSGFGKSTSAKYLAQTHKGIILKLAEPLYDIQNYFYNKIGVELIGQDGELLQFLGHKIQSTSPKYLFDEFKKKLDSIDSELVINDDCRPHNYPYLKDEGFIFVKIEASSRIRKEDSSEHDPNHVVEWRINEVPFDFSITNNGSIEDLYSQLDSLIDSLK